MKTQNHARGLYWFRHDCRLNDMPALSQLAEQTETLLCVYVVDPEWFNETPWGTQRLGNNRWRFLSEGLEDLNNQLHALGNRLVILEGKPEDVISSIVQEHNISHLGVSAHSGPYERDQLAAVEQKHQGLEVIINHSNYLYLDEDFPFSLENMPDTFSPFRRKVEKYSTPNLPKAEAVTIPHPFDLNDVLTKKFKVTHNLYKEVSERKRDFRGGESEALGQIQHYFFNTDNISRYKETRNGMLGWDYSSKLSAWLAMGHISPRTVLAELKRYESERVSNDSTYWLFFELLWREFFHWQLLKHGSSFFTYSGIQNRLPTTVVDKTKLANWQNGNTGYEIVDACMKELNETGFMSNRGRQLAASCFVHELNLDWRYGAAYFEQQLIDFDVASNYGNWQYLAGVGSDPRGHRQFNLAKQTQQYDGDGRFRKAWLT